MNSDLHNDLRRELDVGAGGEIAKKEPKKRSGPQEGTRRESQRRELKEIAKIHGWGGEQEDKSAGESKRRGWQEGTEGARYRIKLESE